jgi:bifunctional non-homologous end joining protein LigD
VTATVQAGRREIPVTHPERVVFAEAGLTKLDLARYLADVADAAVPHLRGRPLAMHTFPRGVGGEGYFSKNVPKHFPDWIRTVDVPKREGGAIRQVLADDAATLAYLAGQNTIALHVWSSRADRLERPDRLVFDLDPSVQRFDEVRAAARETGALLRDLGLRPYTMTTGSRGLHVVVPLQRRADFGEVHDFGRAVAARLAAAHPDRLTSEFRREKRGERIYLDVNRTAYGQHAIAPYSPRALPNAPVATPLQWDELDDPGLDPQGWTMATVLDRLAERGGDPWKDIGGDAKALGAARRALGDG